MLMRCLVSALLITSVVGCSSDTPASSAPAEARVQPPFPAEPELPPAAKDYWDFVGTYRLRERGTDWDVRVYSHDTDSVAEKEWKRGGSGDWMYPNFFKLYAVYRPARGEWRLKELYSGARVGLARVGEVKPESVELIFTTKFLLRVGQKDVNQEGPHHLSIKDGVPQLK
jgi:hypothetical protein